MVGEQNIENRRNFYRIKLLAPMCAELTILTINAKEVTKGFSPICIEDIGVGGVRFKSKLNIPMNDTVTFGIKFSIYDTEYLLPASIVWKNELKTGYIEYGCKFEMKDTEREQYIPIFNRFSVEVAKNIKNIYSECKLRRGKCSKIIIK
ncbi:PilZ domain-containing protein [uncultured Clostridium sp.]|uniref:PilZ domain-containing protein n=1 Tax=uncultured Clostridium sp. TaxID=59620 RepID=UPI0025D70276|nr:PilZ domain-containing protein [uncultured Clostridium sp.]